MSLLARPSKSTVVFSLGTFSPTLEGDSFARCLHCCHHLGHCYRRCRCLRRCSLGLLLKKVLIFFNPIISGCRPTFLVFDSDNSLAFASLPHYFDMPLVVLMSPQVSKHACVLLNIRFWLGKVAKKNSRKKSGLLPNHLPPPTVH